MVQSRQPVIQITQRCEGKAPSTAFLAPVTAAWTGSTSPA